MARHIAPDLHWNIFLGEVYEVLQINVIPVCSDVVVYKEIQLVFDPVFENKCQNSSGELQEENNSQEHRKKLEKESVFPQSSNAPCKSQNEHHSSHHKEEPDRVEAAEISDRGDIGQNSFFIPRPQSNSKKCYSQKPKYDIEAKYEIFDATTDFRTLVVLPGHPLGS